MDDVPEDVQRWTAKRRVALVVSIVKGETSVAEAARKHGLVPVRVLWTVSRPNQAAAFSFARIARGVQWS